jgi:hypothetical protein
MTPNTIDQEVRYLTGKDARTQRSNAAMAEDSQTIRAAWRAGRGTRSIGVTRTPYRQ